MPITTTASPAADLDQRRRFGLASQVQPDPGRRTERCPASGSLASVTTTGARRLCFPPGAGTNRAACDHPDWPRLTLGEADRAVGSVQPDSPGRDVTLRMRFLCRVAAEGDGLLVENDMRTLLPYLEAFHARLGRFFPRSESRAWSRKYLTERLLSTACKNVENLTEQVGASVPAAGVRERLALGRSGLHRGAAASGGREAGGGRGGAGAGRHRLPEEGEVLGGRGPVVFGDPGANRQPPS